LTTHTIQQKVRFEDPMPDGSNRLPYIDNTVILAQPFTSEHPTVTPSKGNLYSASADVSTNIKKTKPISQSRHNSSKINANENTIVETSIRRMNEGIDELEDQSVNIFTEVKKISYNMSLINRQQSLIISRLENIENLMKR
jgi:hypothetical protein